MRKKPMCELRMDEVEPQPQPQLGSAQLSSQLRPPESVRCEEGSRQGRPGLGLPVVQCADSARPGTSPVGGDEDTKRIVSSIV